MVMLLLSPTMDTAGATDWGQFNFDARHSGRNPFENKLRPSNVHRLERAWVFRYRTGSVSSPVVAEGRLFVSVQWRVFALDVASGEQLWRRRRVADPTVRSGLVVVSGLDGLQALDASTGDVAWRTDLFCSPRAITTRTVYTSCNNSVGAFHLQSGLTRFVWDGPNDLGYPAVARDKIFVGQSEGDPRFFSVDASTGDLVWEAVTHDVNAGYPLVSRGVVLYPTYDGGPLEARDVQTGELRWTRELGYVSSPAAAGDRLFLATPGAIQAIALDTGATLWSRNTDGIGDLWAVVFANEVVYAQAGDGIHMFRAKDGKPLGALRIHATSNPSVTPLIVDGVVIAATNSRLIAWSLPHSESLQR